MKEITANMLRAINQVELALSKHDKEFTHEFPILGTMTGKGETEEDCKRWDKQMPFLNWKEASISLMGKKNADILIGQYIQALANADEIMASLRTHKYVMALAAIGEDVVDATPYAGVTISSDALDGEPGISVFYQFDKGVMYFFIQNGAITQIQLTLDDDLPN